MLNTEVAVELPDRAAPTLGAAALAELAPFGEERAVQVGDILYRAGDDSYDFFVVLEGAVDIIRPDLTGDTLLTTHGVGRFLGELNLVSGQRVYLTARVRRPGRVLAIPADQFRRVMSTKPDLADTIFSAFVARREVLRTGEGARSVRIIGSRYSSEAMALRAFAARSRVPHTWIDVEDDDDVEVLLAGMGFQPRDTPVVITTTGVLRRPSPDAFAEHLGLTFRQEPGYMFDLVVVGGGPAGLAAGPPPTTTRWNMYPGSCRNVSPRCSANAPGEGRRNTPVVVMTTGVSRGWNPMPASSTSTSSSSSMSIQVCGTRDRAANARKAIASLE